MDQIIVGYDGSAEAVDALRWAAEAAQRRGAQVLVLQSWNEPILDDRSWVEVWEDPEGHRKQVDAALAEVVASVARDHPEVPFDRSIRRGRPGAMLLEASEDALMVVVGARGRGGFAGLRLGSVSRQVASAASTTAIVVRKTEHPGGPVVVGVDGLPSARAALWWAAQEAKSRGVRLAVVMAWSYLLPEAIDGPVLLRADYTAVDARRALRRIVGEALGPEPGVEVDLDTPCELAGRALIGRSAEASLLVVGPREGSMQRRVDLGSVSAQVIRHAACSVAVVRDALDEG